MNVILERSTIKVHTFMLSCMLYKLSYVLLIYIHEPYLLPTSSSSYSFFPLQNPISLIIMKRSFFETELDSITMASCLMLLSQGKETGFPSFELPIIKDPGLNSSVRTFECKTCNRQFPSFQALGGHRASHKKPKLVGSENETTSSSSSSPRKPKSHECSICGLEFAIGQALGGHMRRHRATQNTSNDDDQSSIISAQEKVMKSNSKRVLCLDLNLTPYENDLELFRNVGKSATPMVDCFF